MSREEKAPLQVGGEGLLAGMGGALALTAMMVLGRKAMAGIADPASDGKGGQERADQAGRTDHQRGLTAGKAPSEGPSMPPV